MVRHQPTSPGDAASLLSTTPDHVRRLGEGLGLEVVLSSSLDPVGGGCGPGLLLLGCLGVMGTMLFAEPWVALGMLPGLVFVGLLLWWLRLRPSALALDRERVRVGGWTAPIWEVEQVQVSAAGRLEVRTSGRTHRWALDRDPVDVRWFARLATGVLRRPELLEEVVGGLARAPAALEGGAERWSVPLVVARAGWWAPATRWLAWTGLLASALLSPILLVLGLWSSLPLLAIWLAAGLAWVVSRRSEPLGVVLDLETLRLGALTIPLGHLRQVDVVEGAGWTWLVVQTDLTQHRWPLRRGIGEAAALAETATRLASLSSATAAAPVPGRPPPPP